MRLKLSLGSRARKSKVNFLARLRTHSPGHHLPLVTVGFLAMCLSEIARA